MEVVMSKRRRTDYNRMSSYNEVEETKVLNEVPEEIEEVRIEQPEPEVIYEQEFWVVEKGRVANCEKLNVRKSASADAPVVTIIEKGTEVEINPNKSVDGWYAIDNGFVMSKFIEKE